MDSQYRNLSNEALGLRLRARKFEALVHEEFSWPWGRPAEWDLPLSVQEAIDLIDRAGVWRRAVAS